MELFYYQRADKLRNFGDSLNPWLWERLLPNFFDGDPSTTFVGFGTLLNNLLS
jgi:succinoglycan biosynthesis protein ExoV